MTSAGEPLSAADLGAKSERLAELADTAELMNDLVTAEYLRARAADYRDLALRRLDG